LSEIGYGRWEGLTKEFVEREYHDDYISWLADPAWHAPTGGELAVVIARRGSRVVEEITQQFADGNVLIVSHKATIRIILCSLLGIDVGRFRYRLVCPVGSVSIVEFTSEGPLLQSLADRSHLSETLKSLPGT
jgi:probable phosphoglycerate mutase